MHKHNWRFDRFSEHGGIYRTVYVKDGKNYFFPIEGSVVDKTIIKSTEIYKCIICGEEQGYTGYTVDFIKSLPKWSLRK